MLSNSYKLLHNDFVRILHFLKMWEKIFLKFRGLKGWFVLSFANLDPYKSRMDILDPARKWPNILLEN